MTCELCSKEHDGKYGSGRFCTSSCARSFATKTKRQEINNKLSIINGIKRICSDCGATFIKHRNYGSRKYCIDCKRLPSKYTPFNNLKGDKARRLRLIKEHGTICSVCNLSIWNSKPMPVELDHIDGNPENNLKENLRLICPNCHAQTDTYKGKNVNKHRNTRRQLVMARYPNYRIKT